MSKGRMSGLSLKALYKLGWFNGTMRHIHTSLHGRQWIVPVIDRMGFETALGIETEPWIYKTLQELHAKSPIQFFIDVGVNTGQTLIKIKSIHQAITYYGFEANPTCVYYVDYLIRLNKVTDANLMCVGLGQETGILHLVYEGQEDTRASFINIDGVFKKQTSKRKVPVMAFDSLGFTADRGQHIVFKVDVEGFEKEVLNGAKYFIQSYQPTLLFEVLPHFRRSETIQRQIDLFDFLIQHGYKVVRILSSGVQEDLEAGFENETDYTKTDYLGLPNNKPG